MFSCKTKIVITNDEKKIFEKNLGSKVAIITDKFLHENGHLNNIKELIQNKEYIVYDEVKPDPTEELVEDATKIIRDFEADTLLCFGGGSAIDLTKGVIYNIVNKYGDQKPLFITIPTTAGTGSEVTNFSIITRGQVKDVLIDDDIISDIAILNSNYTKTVPGHIIADTGIDVLTHAIEAYLSIGANQFTDALALEAIKLSFENLESIYIDNLNSKKRENMLVASSMAGLAFTNAGLGINHSMAHVIGGRYHISHGRLNGIILPYLVRYYIQSSADTRERLDKLSFNLNIGSAGDFLLKLEDLLRKLNFENSLESLDKIDEHDYMANINQMSVVAYNDRCTSTSPGLVSKQILRNLLSDVYKGRYNYY